jgi:hypothetical protein
MCIQQIVCGQIKFVTKHDKSSNLIPTLHNKHHIYTLFCIIGKIRSANENHKFDFLFSFINHIIFIKCFLTFYIVKFLFFIISKFISKKYLLLSSVNL